MQGEDGSGRLAGGGGGGKAIARSLNEEKEGFQNRSTKIARFTNKAFRSPTIKQEKYDFKREGLQ